MAGVKGSRYISKLLLAALLGAAGGCVDQQLDGPDAAPLQVPSSCYENGTCPDQWPPENEPLDQMTGAMEQGTPPPADMAPPPPPADMEPPPPPADMEPPPPPADMEPPPPGCEIPEGGRCVGDVFERCVGEAEVRTDCAGRGERCVTEGGASRCAPPPEELDPCFRNYCNGHGWCEAGVCICDPGHGGANCDLCAAPWGEDELGNCVPLIEIFGTGAEDLLRGGDEGELIRGRGGDDTIRGFGGDDYINGNAGFDYLNGNTGRDEVHGGSDDDEVRGGGEDDVVYGDGGNDLLIGDFGNDRLIGGEGDDVLEGGDGDDRYLLDGLGDDQIVDPIGFNVARCDAGIRITGQRPAGAALTLDFNTGGSLTFTPGELEIQWCDP